MSNYRTHFDVDDVLDVNLSRSTSFQYPSEEDVEMRFMITEIDGDLLSRVGKMESTISELQSKVTKQQKTIARLRERSIAPPQLDAEMFSQIKAMINERKARVSIEAMAAPNYVSEDQGGEIARLTEFLETSRRKTKKQEAEYQEAIKNHAARVTFLVNTIADRDATISMLTHEIRILESGRALKTPTPTSRLGFGQRISPSSSTALKDYGTPAQQGTRPVEPEPRQGDIDLLRRDYEEKIAILNDRLAECHAQLVASRADPLRLRRFDDYPKREDIVSQRASAGM